MDGLLNNALTLSGTMMFGRTSDGDMSMEPFLCLGLYRSRSLCFLTCGEKNENKKSS